jgi:hypothetical protein
MIQKSTKALLLTLLPIFDESTFSNSPLPVGVSFSGLHGATPQLATKKFPYEKLLPLSRHLLCGNQSIGPIAACARPPQEAFTEPGREPLGGAEPPANVEAFQRHL